MTKQYFPFLIFCLSGQFFHSNLIAHHLHWAQSKSFICCSYYCCFHVAVVVTDEIRDSELVSPTHVGGCAERPVWELVTIT